MLTGFGSFGLEEDEKAACEAAGNVYTGEQPYPCVSPEYLLGGAEASKKAALEQARRYPGLFCSAAGGDTTWYGTCDCPAGDANCRKLVGAAKINEVFGISKPVAYGLFAAVGVLGVAAAVTVVRRRRARG